VVVVLVAVIAVAVVACLQCFDTVNWSSEKSIWHVKNE